MSVKPAISRNWILEINGEILGPFSIQQVEEMLSCERITLDTRCAPSESGGHWISVREIVDQDILARSPVRHSPPQISLRTQSSSPPQRPARLQNPPLHSPVNTTQTPSALGPSPSENLEIAHDLLDILQTAKVRPNPRKGLSSDIPYTATLPLSQSWIAKLSGVGVLGILALVGFRSWQETHSQETRFQETRFKDPSAQAGYQKLADEGHDSTHSTPVATPPPQASSRLHPNLANLANPTAKAMQPALPSPPRIQPQTERANTDQERDNEREREEREREREREREHDSEREITAERNGRPQNQSRGDDPAREPANTESEELNPANPGPHGEPGGGNNAPPRVDDLNNNPGSNNP